jgi:6-hydroxycyclohex-1-ene-1-carbonyl-CoA dehydrogenase
MSTGKNAIEGFRWVMTAVGQPMVRENFTAQPQAGEVVVKVAGCGVCHTDLGYFYDGVRTNMPLPLALGHEISGHVVAAGPGAESWVGKTVLVPSVAPCGKCELCKSGLGTICRTQKMPGNDIQGAFGSHVVVPDVGLCAVDEKRLAKAGLELADISVVADAVTTPYQAVLQADIKPGTLAVVIGIGGVGSYAAQIAAAFGATVVALDVDKDKLAKIAQYGAAKTINLREVEAKDVKKMVAAFAKEKGLPGLGWTILECSGTPGGQSTAWNLLVHGATLCVVGFTMEKVEVRLSNLMAFHARALGNWGCLVENYPAALDLALDGKIQVKPFVEQHPLADINRVFDDVHHRKISRRAILIP